jgi:hypothetical protein
MMRIVQQALIPISHSFLPKGKGEEGEEGGGEEGGGVPKLSHGPPLGGRLKTTKPVV